MCRRVGFAVRELDDQRVVVVFVTPGGPAAQAGIRVGAEIIQFGGLPVQQALTKSNPSAAIHGFRLRKKHRFPDAVDRRNHLGGNRNPGFKIRPLK